MKWVSGFVCGALVVAGGFYLFATPAYPLPADDEILAPPAASSSVPPGTPRWSLKEAEERGLVEYHLSGTGSSSGESMLVAVRNLSGSPLDVYIAPGTVLDPGGADAQTMIAWGITGVIVDEDPEPSPVTSLYLPGPEPRIALIEAYCLDFSRPNPEATHTYAVAAQPDIANASVLYAAKKEGYSVAATQIAVWKNRDDHITQQEIEAKFEGTQEEFDQAFELVKRVRKQRARR